MKKRIIKVICILLSVPLVVFPVASVLVYEVIFSQRYETPDWPEFSVEAYENLQVQRCEISTDYGITLAGYQYEKNHETYKGVVVVSHGLGGGHSSYMPIIDHIASGGYYVFAYDATGNDNSTGNSVRGLPQGIKDLNSALCYVKETPLYEDLPILLFGHSWGAYSVGNVLNMHPDVKAAVLVAGFNESEDMLLYHAQNMVGFLARPTAFYVFLYEKIKFGSQYTDLTAVEGIEKSEAEILVVHSKDDTTVPAAYGHDVFYEAFGEDGRVDYILYEDKGHNRLLCSDTFEPNPELMAEVMALYDECCA